MKSLLKTIRSTFSGGKKNTMKKFVDEVAPQAKTEVTHHQGNFILWVLEVQCVILTSIFNAESARISGNIQFDGVIIENLIKKFVFRVNVQEVSNMFTQIV